MSQPAFNPAVLNCLQAFQVTLSVERGKGLTHQQAEKRANAAFLEAMPTIADAKSIQDFIACVRQAVLLDLLSEDRAAILLGGAQSASWALSRTLRRSGRPKSGSQAPLPEN